MKHILTALLILTIISTGCTAHKESSSNDETVTSLTEISTEASAETVTIVPDEDSTAFEYDGDMAYNTDEKYSVVVQELKEQYGYIGDVKGVFLAADDEEIIFTAFTNSYERDGVTKINEFDPSISKIQTFCISRINNEAWRAWMKIKNHTPEQDCNSPVVENTVEAINTDEVMDSINDFARYCNKKGVSIDIDKFYKDYTEYTDKKEYSAPLIVYAWWRGKNREVGGRYDIQKTKR